MHGRLLQAQEVVLVMLFASLFQSRKPKQFPLSLYNTLGKSKQLFTLPTQAKTVRMYNCGPTVYDTQHIGNLSMFVFADTLRRVLEYNNFSVKQVINITDVGHLTSDSDEGEDKMTKGLEREGKELTLENMRALGEQYTKIFLSDLETLNIGTARITFPSASAYIPTQIAMVATLEEKGYAYKAEDGVYYDTSRFPSYGQLGGINADARENQARVANSSGKRNPADFALWKFNKTLGWDSPWGKGFPGWHIECSAMIRATLGEQIDIHTGGIEHIAVHHNNEIAQSEAVTGKKPFSRFWMHRAHVQLEGSKLAKSKGNVIYLSDIIKRGFHPLALRYLFLGAHYRTSSSFSWGALEASQTAYLRLYSFADGRHGKGAVPAEYQKRILERFNDDLDVPGALSVVWEMVKDNELSAADIRAGLLDADRVLGLNLSKQDSEADAAFARQFGKRMNLNELPQNIQNVISDRAEARKTKNWPRADLLRKQLASQGYILEDNAEETAVFKR